MKQVRKVFEGNSWRGCTTKQSKLYTSGKTCGGALSTLGIQKGHIPLETELKELLRILRKDTKFQRKKL